MLTMQDSVSMGIRVGINQGTLFKVMEAKNKKDVKILICLLYLVVCRKKDMMSELEEGAKGNLIDYCKIRLRQNVQKL